MKHGTREAMVLSEVLRLNSGMIDHYNLYLNSCQDQQLRTILDRQQRHTLDTFQRLTQIAQSHGIDTATMPLPTTMTTAMGGTRGTTGTSPYGTQWSAAQYGAGTGQQQQTFTGQAGIQYESGYNATAPGMGTQAGTQMGTQMGTQPGSQMGMQMGTTSAGTMLNDRAIAEGALMFHKYSAEANTRAALESSEPHLRGALTNMARNCIEMSYELYNFMAQRGWYQLPSSPQNFISHSTTQQQYPTQ